MKQVKSKQYENQKTQIFSLIKQGTVTSNDNEGFSSGKNEDFELISSICNKQKRIRRKPESFIEKLKIQSPISFQHVNNFLHMVGINERAMRDKSHQQSYYRTIFYIKTVEKVQVRKNALIIYLRNSQNSCKLSEKHKIQYLVDRFKSYGNLDFYQLALKLENSYTKYNQIDFKSKLAKSFDSQPLSRFIESMQDKVYMCKIASNKLVISRGLLELLGEDIEAYALRLCKYKTPLKEIISPQQYSSVILKSIDNITHLCDFLEQKIDFQGLQQATTMEFNDYLYSSRQKKIFCRLKLHMPTPLMNCIEVIQKKHQCDQFKTFNPKQYENSRMINRQIEQVRFRQADSLKNITSVQNNMLFLNKMKTAGYMPLQASRMTVQQVAQ